MRHFSFLIVLIMSATLAVNSAPLVGIEFGFGSKGQSFQQCVDAAQRCVERRLREEQALAAAFANVDVDALCLEFGLDPYAETLFDFDVNNVLPEEDLALLTATSSAPSPSISPAPVLRRSPRVHTQHHPYLRPSKHAAPKSCV